MKNIYLILSVLLLVFSSCSDDENGSPKQVKLSSTEVAFAQEGGVAYIEAEGGNWWLNEISAVDNDGRAAIYELTSAERKELAATGKI